MEDVKSFAGQKLQLDLLFTVLVQHHLRGPQSFSNLFLLRDHFLHRHLTKRKKPEIRKWKRFLEWFASFFCFTYLIGGDHKSYLWLLGSLCVGVAIFHFVPMIVWSFLHIGHPVQKFADFITVLSLLLINTSLGLK